MIIRIMRHGDAPFIQGERQLSELGITECQSMGQWLNKQDKDVELMLVSPLLRAQQTAKEVQNQLGYDYKQLDELLLKPEASATIAIEYFQALEVNSLMLISHMPLVVNLLDAWLPGQGRYFPTASIAELELNTASIKLNQFVSP